MSTNEGGTKISSFALNYGSTHVLTWIFVQNMWSQKEIFSYRKRNKMRVELEHWNYLLNKVVVIVETNNH
jgi:hypothetical protein